MPSVTRQAGPSLESAAACVDGFEERVTRLVEAVAGVVGAPAPVLRFVPRECGIAVPLDERPGVIVVGTDAVLRALSDGQLSAVLAHEMGHIRYDLGLTERWFAGSILSVAGAVAASNSLAGWDYLVPLTFVLAFAYLPLRARHSERRADAFAKRHGYGRCLGAALHVLEDGHHPGRVIGFDLMRRLGSHPSTASRVRRLSAS